MFPQADCSAVLKTENRVQLRCSWWLGGRRLLFGGVLVALLQGRTERDLGEVSAFKRLQVQAGFETRFVPATVGLWLETRILCPCRWAPVLI
jgi:hypothetical protein